MGPTAVLVDEVDDPAGWAAAFGRLGMAGVVDVVPAARTELGVTDDERSLESVFATLGQVEVDPTDGSSLRHMEIDEPDGFID
jgi:hypothetical protein